MSERVSFARTTRIWCPFCGRYPLEYRLDSEHDSYTYRCVGYCHAGGMIAGYTPRAELTGLSLSSPKPRLTRHCLALDHHYRNILATDPGRCVCCGAALDVYRNTPERTVSSLLPEYSIELRCPICGSQDGASAWHLALDTPEAQRFWRRHPRMRALPVHEVESEGAHALWTGFESADGGARLVVISDRWTYRVLSVQERRRGSVIATLRQRDFALLWLGGLISSVGDWTLAIGLPIYVFLLTHSVLDTGLTLLFGQIPAIALGSIAGVFVDRWDHKRTLVIANCLLAVALLPVLLVVSPDRIWIVYAVAAVESALEQFVSPAVNALIPFLVTEERLVAANSLNSLSSNLARLVGPALGGVIAALWGLGGIVLADAVSFALAALLTAGISARRIRLANRQSGEAVPTSRRNPVGRLAGEWIAGVRAILAERTLMALFLAFAITYLGEGVMGTLYPVFVNQVLHGVALQIGELMTAQAIGGLLGGFLAGWIGERLLSRWLIGMSSVLFGLVDLIIFNIPALAPELLPATIPIFAFEAGLFIAVGIPGIWMSTGGLSLLQASSPDAYRGRIFGLLGATFGLLGLIGIVVASTITERIGVVRMLNIQGIGYVIAGVVLLWLLPRRRTPPLLDVAPVESLATDATTITVDLDVR